MIKAMRTAASGMTAQQMNVDVIANNLSNVNTSGYKKGRADFEDLLYPWGFLLYLLIGIIAKFEQFFVIHGYLLIDSIKVSSRVLKGPLSTES